MTFFAGQPMLISMIRAPMSATIFAASAIGRASRPASCTEDGSSSPSSLRALARTEGLAVSISPEATISDTTSPAPNRATIRRNGRSVIPAIGASSTGGSRR